jgi:hypothetical protein
MASFVLVLVLTSTYSTQLNAEDLIIVHRRRLHCRNLGFTEVQTSENQVEFEVLEC